MNWNQRITEAREARGMSKAAFARACKVSGPTVTDWESGKIKNLDAANMLVICEELEIDPWWLVRGKSSGKPPKREDLVPLSTEAAKVIRWVERCDGLGDPARKVFVHLVGFLQVAHSLMQSQNVPVEIDELREAQENLRLDIDPTEVTNATKKRGERGSH